MLVVFDLDDTLYLERDYVRSGLRAVATLMEERRVPGFFDVACELSEAGWRGKVFDEALCRLGVAANVELIADLVRVYRTHRPSISLATEAAACLARLRGSAKLGLLTDGAGEPQWNKIRALDLGTRMDRIVVTDDFGAQFAKPSPRPFAWIQGGHSATRCLYVGDNPAKDFAGPRHLGWHSVRVRRARGLHAEAADDPRARPERTIPSLEELPAIVEGWSRA